MSAALSVFSAAGSRPGAADAAATRSAWIAVAWFSSRTASRALPEPWSPSARASTPAALDWAAGVSVRPASSAREPNITASCPGVKPGKSMTARKRAAREGLPCSRLRSGAACPARITASSSLRSLRYSVSCSYKRRSTCCPWSGRRCQSCAALIIKIPPLAGLIASASSLAVSPGPTPTRSAAAASMTCPVDRTPSLR